MKILILGGDGMIGHKMAQVLSNFNHQIIVSIREQRELTKQCFSSQVKVFFNDFLKENALNFLDKVNPDVIVNAIGVTIRRGAAENIADTIYINSYFPHQLANWAGIHNKRLIHFSTDCVFSGSEGSYSEDATPNAIDYYGKTKGLGEVFSKNALTLRSSMIGPELFNKTELFEWVINNKEKEINGFSRVIYSGVTTVYMARLVVDLIENHKNLSGIYNIASNPISKFELLHLINDNFDLGLVINKDQSIISNKTLDPSKIDNELGIKSPSWSELIIELKKDYMHFIDLYKTK
ncbi:SDR family oxidoreductase [Flavobacteriaceae bacterium]|nr:SDR family oxidoreductase [Flavobacteriaceae bacterium]